MDAPPTGNGNGRKPQVNWGMLGVISAMFMAAYSVITPATAAYQTNQTTILQILEHQQLQDERINALERKVDKQGDLLHSIDRQTAVIAQRTAWMGDWIRAGGERKN